jgi:hypothetical protein
VIVLKLGRTVAGAHFALSHTGAIAGDAEVYEAMFCHCGVISVRDLNELAAAAILLSCPKRAAPGGLSAVLDSGGERELIVDVASDHGVPFAKINAVTTRVLQETLDSGLQPVNPVDAWGTGKDFELVFEKCLTALMNDPDTGLGMFVADLSEGSVRMATRCATLDANALRLTKIAINRSYGAMGLDGSLRQALELDVEIETTDTEESRTFKALLSQHGVKAAIAWREARFASPSPGTATSQ